MRYYTIFLVFVLFTSVGPCDFNLKSTVKEIAKELFKQDCGEVALMLQGNFKTHTNWNGRKEFWKNKGWAITEYQSNDDMNDDMRTSLFNYNILCQLHKKGVITEQELQDGVKDVMVPFHIAEKELLSRLRDSLDAEFYSQFNNSLTKMEEIYGFLSNINADYFDPIIDSIYTKVDSNLPIVVLKELRNKHNIRIGSELTEVDDALVLSRLNKIVKQIHFALDTDLLSKDQKEKYYALVDNIQDLYETHTGIENREVFLGRIGELEQKVNDFIAKSVEQQLSFKNQMEELSIVVSEIIYAHAGNKFIEPVLEMNFNYQVNQWKLSVEDQLKVSAGLQNFLGKNFQYDVVGYADRTGVTTRNRNLSYFRSDGIKTFLNQSLNIPLGQINSYGAGETEFYKGGLGENRRVNLFVYLL